MKEEFDEWSNARGHNMAKIPYPISPPCVSEWICLFCCLPESWALLLAEWKSPSGFVSANKGNVSKTVLGNKLLPKFNFAVLTFLSKDFKEARNIFSWPQERVFGNLTRISLGEKTHSVHFLEDFRPAQRKNSFRLFVIFRDSLRINIFLFRCVSQFINLHLLSKGTKMIPITCKLNERGVIGDLLRCNLEEKKLIKKKKILPIT